MKVSVGARISATHKKQLQELAKNKNTTVSKLIEQYIKRILVQQKHIK